MGGRNRKGFFFLLCCMAGGTTRKRRRGVIEKRRRDRINTSLNELKQLVPTALEKSGSAKLEKAEILQMTVEHLKILQVGMLLLLLLYRGLQTCAWKFSTST